MAKEYQCAFCKKRIETMYALVDASSRKVFCDSPMDRVLAPIGDLKKAPHVYRFSVENAVAITPQRLKVSQIESILPSR